MASELANKVASIIGISDFMNPSLTGFIEHIDSLADIIDAAGVAELIVDNDRHGRLLEERDSLRFEVNLLRKDATNLRNDLLDVMDR